MKEALNSLSFLTNFVLFYILLFCYFHTFFFYNTRKKSKRWVVNFPTFIAVTLEHIHILITLARKLRDRRKYTLIWCAKIKGARKLMELDKIIKIVEQLLLLATFIFFISRVKKLFSLLYAYIFYWSYLLFFLLFSNQIFSLIMLIDSMLIKKT